MSKNQKIQDRINDFFRQKTYYERIRNMAIIAHVDHGKSTLVDNLLAESNMLAKDAVGATLTDIDSQEKERGITINNSAISIFFEDLLFNLVDTPGHVDFGSEVAKSLRSIDGAVLVMDSIEGVMVQTESVISQALKQNVQLLLMVNKVDRLVTELKLGPEEIYKKLVSNVAQVNNLIKKLTASEKDYFQLDRNVVFGSALKKWAFTITELQRNNDKFSFFVDKILKKEELSEKYNLAKILLKQCSKTFKDPLATHEANLKHYFRDDPDLLSRHQTFVKQPLKDVFRGIVTDINYDKTLGLLHTVRVVSGTFERTKNLYSSEDGYKNPVKKPTRYSLALINKYVEIEVLLPGSIVTLQGCDIKHTGTTLSQKEHDEVVFPQITYMREPIFCLAVMPEKLSEVGKMVDCLKILCLEDPTLQFNYDETSKEFTLAGVGVLHLEVTLKKLELNHGVRVKTGAPRIPYVETLEDDLDRSETVAVRSSNKHNDFRFYLFNLPGSVTKRLLNKQITAKTLNSQLEKDLPRDLAKSAAKILDYGNVYFDMTHGADFMEECKTLLGKSLSFTLSRGVKLPNPIKGVGVVITYSLIHEDPLHRTEIQLRGAFREGVEQIFTKTNPSVIKEPIMKLTVRAPMEHTESVSVVINNRRGYLIENKAEEYGSYVQLIYMIPLAETMDLSTVIMSATEGRAVFFMDFEQFDQVPSQVLKTILTKDQKKP